MALSRLQERNEGGILDADLFYRHCYGRARLPRTEDQKQQVIDGWVKTWVNEVYSKEDADILLKSLNMDLEELSDALQMIDAAVTKMRNETLIASANAETNKKKVLLVAGMRGSMYSFFRQSGKKIVVLLPIEFVPSSIPDNSGRFRAIYNSMKLIDRKYKVMISPAPEKAYEAAIDLARQYNISIKEITMDHSLIILPTDKARYPRPTMEAALPTIFMDNPGSRICEDLARTGKAI